MDTVQQYFRDISRDIPKFENISIYRVLHEPEDLEGPDTYVIRFPLGIGEPIREEFVAEETLQNP